MTRKLDVPDKGQFGPRYDVSGAALAKHRTLARNGLQAMTYEQRQAYGAAVEAAVVAAQARALRGAGEPEPRPNCASGSWANAPGEVGDAVRRRQRTSLAACASQERRARTPHEWERMYLEAMPEGFKPSWERKAAAEDAEAQAIAERVLAGGWIFEEAPERVAA